MDPRTEPNGRKTPTPLQQRYRVLERELAKRNRDLERSRQNIRSLVAQLDLAEERERKQLATDLHDYLAQLLALGHMKVGELKRFALPPKGDELARDVEGVLSQALHYCRTLMTELSSPNLKEEGLAAGIRSLSTQMKRYGLEVTVQTDPLESTSVSESASALLLRSVRELPINTVKHAAVKQASIRIPAQMDTFRSSWGTRAARILPLPRTDWLRELVLLSLRDSAFSLSGNE